MEDILKQISELDPEDILAKEDNHFFLGDTKDKLKLLVIGAGEILNNANFKKELPEQTKTSITNSGQNLLSTINEIKANKDNTPWLTSNFDGQKNSLNTYYEQLYPHLVVSIRDYNLATNTKITEYGDLLRKLRKSVEESEQNRKLVGEAASSISTAELAKFFDEVANGNFNEIKKKHKKLGKLFIYGFKRTSWIWLGGTILVALGTGLLAFWIFPNLDKSITFEELIAKALILAPFAYVIRFCAKQYSINKNLYISYLHRAVVMKTLLAFLARDEIPADVKASIITEASSQVFKLDNLNLDHDSGSIFDLGLVGKKIGV